ncbi:MAG: DUF4861 family protein [Bacteroidota bacterium]
MILNKKSLLAGALLVTGWMAFLPLPHSIPFTVRNPLKLARSSETVSLPMVKLSLLVKEVGAENLLVKDAKTGTVLVSQLLDNNADGQVDELLFQTDLPALGEKKFVVEGSKDGAAKRADPKLATYSRFVPERIDDYAWENDRVAFRTYGPKAQQLTEAGRTDGTLTSGMDCWLKRVDYPIIDLWYKKDKDKTGSYHQDTGEGYDPYHVGGSRGCGGIGIWKNDSLYVSKNYTSYKTIAKGPIRTVFELTYASWNAGGVMVTEKKRISLDLGSNLSRYEVELFSSQALPNCTVGITLHDKKGTAKGDPKAGWFRYWEPMDDSELGLGLVMSPKAVMIYQDHRVEAKDQSHLLVIAKPSANRLVYYAGFGWKKSGQFDTVADWDAYLSSYAQRIASPLEVKW